MPKYNTGQDFDEAFINGLQFQQKINQQRDELRNDIMFKMRQLDLTEEYHNILGDKYKKDYELDREKFDETKRINDFNMGKQPKPEEGVIRTEKGGGLISDIYGYKEQDIKPPTTTTTDGMEDILLGDIYNKEFITKIERRNDPTYEKPEKENNGSGDGTGDGSKIDISNEVGELEKLKTLYGKLGDKNLQFTNGKGETVKVDYKVWKALTKQYYSDALSKTGIPLEGDVINTIRNYAKGTGKTLLEAIDDARRDGIELLNGKKFKMNDKQYEAARYWAQLGSM